MTRGVLCNLSSVFNGLGIGRGQAFNLPILALAFRSSTIEALSAGECTYLIVLCSCGGIMSDLKSLSDKVAATIANQDGSWQARKEMLDAIEELHVTAMGPSEYITRLRYQVGLSSMAKSSPTP